MYSLDIHAVFNVNFRACPFLRLTFVNQLQDRFDYQTLCKVSFT